MGLSPLQVRMVALGSFLVISGLLIGTSVYNTYFNNPVEYLPEYMEIEEFTMPSNTGELYSFDPNGQEVAIVSFMYTKCPGDVGCSLLTANMADLEDRVKNRGWTNINQISIDFDYINDTMHDLQEYAVQYTNDFDYWKFLLGDENKTKSVAEQFAFYFEPRNSSSNIQLSHSDDPSEEPYIHSMLTYVLDRNGVVRKFIQGTQWDFQDIMYSIEFLQSDDWTTSQRQ